MKMNKYILPAVSSLMVFFAGGPLWMRCVVAFCSGFIMFGKNRIGILFLFCVGITIEVIGNIQLADVIFSAAYLLLWVHLFDEILLRRLSKGKSGE